MDSFVKTSQVVAELHAVFARKRSLISAAATQAHRGSFDDFFGQKIRNFNSLHNALDESRIDSDHHTVHT